LSGSFPKIAKSSGLFVRCQSPLEKFNFEGYDLDTNITKEFPYHFPLLTVLELIRNEYNKVSVHDFWGFLISNKI